MSGEVYRLSGDGAAWEKVGELTHPRFFHRLVPAEPNRLLALGGEDNSGKRADLEWILPSATPSTTPASP